MIYFLLKPFAKISSLANFLSYVSVRTLASLFISLIIWLIFGRKFIQLLKTFQGNGSVIRDLGQSEKSKKGATPTAGGIFIIAVTVLNALLWCDLQNTYVVLLLFTSIVSAVLGFVDDYLKVSQRNYDGVSPVRKLSAQFVLCSVIYVVLLVEFGGDHVNMLNIPFLKNTLVNLGPLYLLFMFCVIAGTSNAVNLSDGLDGLAVGPIIISTVFVGFVCYISGHVHFAGYLHVPYINGASEIVVFCGALFGACLGFLWYNAYPAAVFMGDTGSLSIGATLGLIALIVKQELIFALVSFVFVWEAISVMIQVFFYKKTKKRVFLMAPFHHHLEKIGWSETQVVIRSWIASFIFAIIGLVCIKLQ